MPRIKSLPALEVIRALKGTLDFYYWKGLPCVRKWPVIRPSSRSQPSLASAALFGAIIRGYQLIGAVILALLEQDATDQPRTARDLFVSAVLGHLHSVPMTDFLDLLTEATAYLKALADLRNALDSQATDQLLVNPAYDGDNWKALLVDAQRHLQADILASALPTGAATLAKQNTMITALQLIDDLRSALETVHTDRLLVRGMDQLFSIKGKLEKYARNENTIAGDVWIELGPVPEDELWAVTAIVAADQDSAITRIETYHRLFDYRGHVAVEINPAPIKGLEWSGLLIADPDDSFQARFTDCVLHDTISFRLQGYTMTLET